MNLIILIDDQHLGQVQEIVSKLESIGMTINNILKVSGLIVGEASEDALSKLELIPGILAIKNDMNSRNGC